MRTTIDLPDPLFRAVKSTAAARGLKLKEFIAESLRDTLKQGEEESQASLTPAEAHRRRMEKHFAAMNKERLQTGPLGPFNREELHDRHA
jgi:hypothetical protein